MNLKFKDYINYKTYIVMDSEDYRYIGDYSEGYFAVKHKNGLCGYINESGYENFLFDYVLVNDFKNGRALVQNKKGLYGYIDTDFKEAITCKFICATEFWLGYAIVKDYMCNFIIDLKGNIVKQLDEEIDFEQIKKILYKNKLISRQMYEESIDIKNTTDIVKMPIVFKQINQTTYSYFNQDNQKIIYYDNLEDRDFIHDFVVVKVDNYDYRIYKKSGKYLKIHSCIDFNISYDPDKIKKVNELKYRVSNKIEDGLVSILELDDVVYRIYAKDKEELYKRKLEVLEDIKAYSNSETIVESSVKTL